VAELAKAGTNEKMLKRMMSEDAKAAKAAFKDWENLPEENRRRVLEKVYCGKCMGAVEIVDYKVVFEGIGLVLRGKCKKCGHKVARVLEGEC
jgi:hypothetical protein